MSENIENDPKFIQVTNNLYQLIRSKGGKLLMSRVNDEYFQMFGKPFEFVGNPKYFVKMERLLLLNCSENANDVMIFYTPEPAYKLVVSVLKQHAQHVNAMEGTSNINHHNGNNNNNNGNSNNSRIDNVNTNENKALTVAQFQQNLEERMGMTLDDCNFIDFLMRWRFLSIRKNSDNAKIVLFTPHQSGSTVFFGNLSVDCTEKHIYNDLIKCNSRWSTASVRLKQGKGFNYAFVDFPSREDALAAVEQFDGKSGFNSNYISADIEAIEQRKRYNAAMKQNNRSGYNNHNNNSNRHNNGGYNNRRKYYNNQNNRGGYNRGYNNNSRHNNNNNQYSMFGSLLPPKTTVYLGNLRDNVRKIDIQNELGKVDNEWKTLTIRLNLRSGWSHAFVDFESQEDARKLMNLWHNMSNSLTNVRLRCEISKRQMP